MATKKKNTLNEDVDLLNEGEKASETPATLVSPSPDQEYNATGALLSPNPAKSGFTSQRVVDALPATGEYNVIYIVPIKNNGSIIGYRKWRWDVETSSYKRVYGSIPNLSLGDGQRETPVINSNPNRNSTKVFNEDVVFNGQVKIGGKTIEDYVDSEGGVTEEELEDALLDVDTKLALKANLSGANFSGAVGALTLKQTLANKTFNGNWNFNSATYELTDIYTRVEEINSVLYCIANIKLKRVAADGNMYYIANFSVILDEETASKVFDMQGNSLLTTPSQAVLITGVPATVYDSIQGDNPGASTTKTVFLNVLHLPGISKSLGLYFSSMGSPITQGSELYLTARIPLSLI